MIVVSRIRNSLILLPVVVVLAACTFDYSESRVEARDREELPQLEVLNVRMVVERDNRLELTAARIATFDNRRVQEFREVQFREFGPDGEIRLEGTAESGVLFLDSEDIELHGTVEFYSQPEGARLESSFLYWDQADRILRGEPDGSVSILRDDGSWVLGTGLRLDGRRNSVELTGGLEGEFVSGEGGP